MTRSLTFCQVSDKLDLVTFHDQGAVKLRVPLNEGEEAAAGRQVVPYLT